MAKSSHRSVRFTPQIETAVLEYCEKTGLTYAHVLREAVRFYLAAQTESQPEIPARYNYQTYVAGEDIKNGDWLTIGEDSYVWICITASDKPIGFATADTKTGHAISVCTAYNPFRK